MIIREPAPNRVDAVLMDGGDDRHRVAAQWIKSRFANTILLTRRLDDRNVAAGIVPPDDVSIQRQLIELGVSDEAIQCLSNSRVRGEWRTYRLLGEWLSDHPEARVVILCDQFDSRYTRFVVDQILPDAISRQVYVHGLPSLVFDERSWWHSRLATRQMFAAVFALGYARWVGEDEDDPITWDALSYEASLKRR